MDPCVKPKDNRVERCQHRIRWWLLDEASSQEFASAIGDKCVNNGGESVQDPNGDLGEESLFKKWQASGSPEAATHTWLQRATKRAVARASSDHLQPLYEKLESSEGQKLIYKWRAPGYFQVPLCKRS
ncbi:unnamed protein product [Arctia plantaginis]|uniref:Uncharacterized protein n=1 Tax=Arctia plantaginis TaxID=874455 RepID=A0A8S0YPE0_ARCPL|nr:unnamed protein product [Arctia plantaginis]